MTVRVLAFVEGPTEEKFAREVLSPSLASQNVFISATTPGRCRAHGGVPNWASAKKELLQYLQEDKARFVTTMFDYYGLPADWPGKEEARLKNSASTKAESVEQTLHADVCSALGESFDDSRFLPYIQMHEFEALLFSDITVLSNTVPDADLQLGLESVLKQCGSPEAIDDNRKTAPSKRICALAPRYQKVLHGIIAARRIGLLKMQEKCPHFAQWLESLRMLSPDPH